MGKKSFMEKFASGKFLAKIIIAVVWLLNFFGVQVIPENWENILKVISSIDLWIINRGQSPTLFILLTSLFMAAVIFPTIVDVIKYLFRPKIEIIPIKLDGFAAPASRGNYQAQYLNILFEIKNFEDYQTSLNDWEIDLNVDGKKYKGAIRVQNGNIEISGADGIKSSFPPETSIITLTRNFISPGTSVFGVLQVEIFDLPAQPLNEKTILIVKARDTKGKEIKSIVSFREVNEKIPQPIPELSKFIVHNEI